MLIFYLILSIGVSFLCSLFEAVVLSLTPAYADSLIRRKKKGAKAVRRVKQRIDDALSAILTLNTIAHTIGAAGVGAEVQRIYGDHWVALGSAILTLLILVLSEIVPKTIGATFWKTLAIPVAYGIQAFIFITLPLVLLFRLLARWISKKDSGGNRVSREELFFVADVGQAEGSFSKEEATILRNLAQLQKVLTKDIMTPRTVVFALAETMTVQEVTEAHPSIPYSRIPIFGTSVDQVTGFVHRYEILAAMSEGKGHVPLRELRQATLDVSPTLSVSALLKRFIDDGAHMFLVFDEHGGLSGVVTLEDAIETLLGAEITDEFDSVEDLRDHARKLWEKRRASRARQEKKEALPVA